MSTITKKEPLDFTRGRLIDRVARTTQTSQARTKVIIQCFLEEMVMELTKGNRLEFRDFGVFEIRTRAARTALNPKTLERVRVPAKRAVKFKIGRLMKQKLDRRPSEQ